MEKIKENVFLFVIIMIFIVFGLFVLFVPYIKLIYVLKKYEKVKAVCVALDYRDDGEGGTTTIPIWEYYYDYKKYRSSPDGWSSGTDIQRGTEKIIYINTVKPQKTYFIRPKVLIVTTVFGILWSITSFSGLSLFI